MELMRTSFSYHRAGRIKFVPIVLLGLVILCAVSNPVVMSNAQPAQQQLLTYESPDFGVTLQYPADWKPLDDEADPKAEFSPIVTFSKGIIGDGNVDIYVDNNPFSTNLEALLNSHIESVEANSEDFTLTDRITSAALAGSPAFAVEYTETLPGEDYGLEDDLQVFNYELGALINGKLYTANYYADSASYLANLPVGLKIIDSLQVNPVSSESLQTGSNTSSPTLGESGSSMVPPESGSSMIPPESGSSMVPPESGSSIIPPEIE